MSWSKGIGPNGKFIIVTGTLTADNQNTWMAEMEKYRQAKYPDFVNLSETPKAPGKIRLWRRRLRPTRLLENVSGLCRVFLLLRPWRCRARPRPCAKRCCGTAFLLTGLATPKMMKEYIVDGTVKRFVLWNPVDLGYLAVYAAVATAKGELVAGATSFKAGHVGEVKVNGTEVILCDPITFDKANIDRFSF